MEDGASVAWNSVSGTCSLTSPIQGALLCRAELPDLTRMVIWLMAFPVWDTEKDWMLRKTVRPPWYQMGQPVY